MRALPLITLLLGGWLTVPVQAADPADARVTTLFSRLAQAEREQDFQGTFVYERNGITCAPPRRCSMRTSPRHGRLRWPVTSSPPRGAPQGEAPPAGW